MNSETRPATLRRTNGATIAYRTIAGKSPGIVFLTGYRSRMEGAKALALEAYARAAGRAYTRFDYTGHGESEGDFESATLSTWIGDALAIVDEVTKGPLVLVGSSMGAWIMLRVALARQERVAGLLGIAAAPDFTQTLMWDLFDDATRQKIMAGEVVRSPSAEGDSETVINRALIEDGRQHLVLQGTIPLRVPVRLLHGLGDDIVPWTLSEMLLAQLEGSDASLTLIKDGGHRLSKPHELGMLIQAIDALCRLGEQQNHPGAAASAAKPSR
jgi:pimeloyl-ACP methyl ester carboxylesterase